MMLIRAMQLLINYIFFPFLEQTSQVPLQLTEPLQLRKKAQIWPYRMVYATVCEHNLDRQPSFMHMQNRICYVNDSIGGLLPMLVC